MNIIEEVGLTFNDVLILPRHSKVKSRSEVDLSVTLNKGFKFSTPFIPANMASITELEMAKLQYQNKNLALLHRFTDLTTQIEWVKEIKTWGLDVFRYVGFSVGVKESDYNTVDIFASMGVQIICVDVAHADSEQCIKFVERIAKEYPDILLIAGTVATGEGATKLWKAKADIVRCGLGNGSICLTRVKSLIGVPQLTALSWCHEAQKKATKNLKRPCYLIGDGGMSTPGHTSAALSMCDLIISGNLFSGCTETPGDYIIESENKLYKSYRGSSTHKSTYREGVEAYVEAKGSAQEVLDKLSQGVKSSLSYQGVTNLPDFRSVVQFIRITNAGLVESGAHDLAKVLTD